jgi:hypothetical protein
VAGLASFEAIEFGEDGVDGDGDAGVGDGERAAT